jgi:glycosyltransferase involved in cell wall biosynthesis
MKTLSILVPVYNEEEVLPFFIRTLVSVLHTLPVSTEVLFIDDGSTDNSAMVIREQAVQLGKVKLLSLSRNFGQQAALLAGLDHCKGDAAIWLDADLQDPPTAMPQFVEKWLHGAEVVLGARECRQHEPFWKIAGAKLFYWIASTASDIHLRSEVSNYILIDRKVINEVIKMREQIRYLKGIVAYVGFKQAVVYYQRQNRPMGKSKYSFRRLLQLAIQWTLAFSYRPLGYFTFMSMVFLSLGVLGIGNRMVMFGIAALFLGQRLQGRYIESMDRNAKNRPIYIIREEEETS